VNEALGITGVWRHSIPADSGDKWAYHQIIFEFQAQIMRRFDHLGDLELFQAAVEAGSFTAAAVTLGLTPSAVSRAVERLERHLGLQLLRRTTRSLSLTDAGRLYLEQSQAAFALLEDAERTLQGHAQTIAGRVRISVPTTWGHHRAAAKLAAFAARYPQVAIELHVSNRNVDLAAEGFDAVVRLGALPDSGLIARPLEDAALCLVASPAYLAQAGTPETLSELAMHACIPFILPSTGKRLPWPLRLDGEDIEWAPPSHLCVADDVLGCVSLAEHGAGITQSYDFVVAQALHAGRLREVLPQTRGRSRRFSLLYAAHRRLSPATRALIEFLTDVSSSP
jgi:DNA-binding transcriptional LysR family regulator